MNSSLSQSKLNVKRVIVFLTDNPRPWIAAILLYSYLQANGRQPPDLALAMTQIFIWVTGASLGISLLLILMQVLNKRDRRYRAYWRQVGRATFNATIVGVTAGQALPYFLDKLPRLVTPAEGLQIAGLTIGIGLGCWLLVAIGNALANLIRDGVSDERG
jgi:hypothetical protein